MFCLASPAYGGVTEKLHHSGLHDLLWPRLDHQVGHVHSREFSDQVDLKMLYALCFIELIHPIMDHKGDPT
jgi:hypothetical protein